MLIPFIVAVILLAVDLISKSVVCAYTSTGERITVLRGILSFTYSENSGASFGLFGDHPVLLLVITTAFSLGLLIFCVVKRKTLPKLAQYSFWIIISGAVGNLYDRFSFGYVRDFIDYEFIGKIIGRDFAICNFADLVLIVGTVMLLIYVLFFYGGEKGKPAVAPENVRDNKAAEETRNAEEKVDDAQTPELPADVTKESNERSQTAAEDEVKETDEAPQTVVEDVEKG